MVCAVFIYLPVYNVHAMCILLIEYVTVGNSAGDTLWVCLSCRGIAAYYFRICTSATRLLNIAV